MALCIPIHLRRRTSRVYQDHLTFLESPHLSGRSTHYWVHPLQIRTCPIKAYGSSRHWYLILSINTYIYFGLYNRVGFYEFIKSFPCIAFSLTTSIHPKEQKLYYSRPKVIHHLIVIRYTVVMIVSCQNLVYFADDKFLLFKSHVSDGDIHLFTFLTKFLSSSSVFNSELSS